MHLACDVQQIGAGRGVRIGIGFVEPNLGGMPSNESEPGGIPRHHVQWRPRGQIRGIAILDMVARVGNGPHEHVLHGGVDRPYIALGKGSASSIGRREIGDAVDPDEVDPVDRCA